MVHSKPRIGIFVIFKEWEFSNPKEVKSIRNYIKLFSPYNSVKESKRGERQMRERVAPLGDKNIVGATVTRLRLEQGITQKALMAKMQTFGADISYSSLSKLEGQTRSVSDKEVYALARSLEVEISALFSVK